MNGISHTIDVRLWAAHDFALVPPGEDPGEALVQSVVQAIGTWVEVTAGGVTMHLAAWQDPDHWESDWAAKGVDDPHEFIAGLVETKD